MNDIINKIKEKKELSGIATSLVEETLNNYLNKFKIDISSLKPSERKIIIKSVRAELRKYAGRFHASSKERKALLNKNKINELLETHSSTKERIDFYPELNEIISRLKVKSILDLGAGINAIAIAKQGIRYTALDINKEDLDIVNEYFIKNGIDGETIVHDLRKPFDFPKSDLCLILKVFDVLETRGHKIAENIIKSIHSKYLLISFPTKTLSNAPMRHPQRGWIELLLHRLGFNFKIIKSKNEIFYLAEKS